MLVKCSSPIRTPKEERDRSANDATIAIVYAMLVDTG
jgi:hypothetical protein